MDEENKTENVDVPTENANENMVQPEVTADPGAGQPPVPNEPQKKGMLSAKMMVILLLIVAAIVGGIVYMTSDDEDTTTTSETEQQETAQRDFSDWVAPDTFNLGAVGDLQVYARLSSSGTAGEDQEFATYDLAQNVDDTFVLRRFSSTKEISVDGLSELNQEQATDIITKINPDLADSGAEMTASIVESIENNIGNDIRQIGLKFVSENDDGQSSYSHWIVQVDFTANVTVVYELTSTDEGSVNFDFIKSLNGNTAYIY